MPLFQKYFLNALTIALKAKYQYLTCLQIISLKLVQG